MSREMNTDASIPANGAEGVPYFDRRELIQGVLRHGSEMFIGQVLGAGGAGGSLLNVPFEPAVVEIINEAGATPQWAKYVNLTSGIIGLSVVLAAADATANAPVISQVAANDWTVLVDTADAPDAETVTVICYAARDIAGGL